jgi:ribosomal protein S18 acetylase RimI-like enzyme
MNIRPLQRNDILALSTTVSALPLMQRYKQTAETIAQNFEGALTRGESLLVFDEGDGAQGFAWFLPSGTFALSGYLRLIAVVPGAHRQGIGVRLLRAYEQGVATKSRHAFLLVSDFNTDAQRFYLRHGYRQVGMLPRFLLPDVDELIFWKRLVGE